MDEQLKTIADFTAVTITVASLLSWLPPLAAFVSIVWGCISIYETKTVQNFIERRKHGSVPKHDQS